MIRKPLLSGSNWASGAPQSVLSDGTVTSDFAIAAAPGSCSVQLSGFHAKVGHGFCAVICSLLSTHERNATRVLHYTHDRASSLMICMLLRMHHRPANMHEYSSPHRQQS